MHTYYALYAMEIVDELEMVGMVGHESQRQDMGVGEVLLLVHKPFVFGDPGGEVHADYRTVNKMVPGACIPWFHGTGSPASLYPSAYFLLPE